MCHTREMEQIAYMVIQLESLVQIFVNVQSQELKLLRPAILC